MLDLFIQSFAKPKLFMPYKKTGKCEEIPSSDTTLWLHPNKDLLVFFLLLLWGPPLKFSEYLASYMLTILSNFWEYSEEILCCFFLEFDPMSQ